MLSRLLFTTRSVCDGCASWGLISAIFCIGQGPTLAFWVLILQCSVQPGVSTGVRIVVVGELECEGHCNGVLRRFSGAIRH